MKVTPRRLQRLATLWLLLIHSVAIGDEPTHQPDAKRTNRLSVVVGIAPYAFLVDRIAGDAATVTTLLSPGQSPATFEPTQSQLATLAKADLYVTAGTPFEQQLVTRLRRQFPALTIIDPHHADHPTATDPHDCEDPHHWLDPQQMMHVAETIANDLAIRAPDMNSEFDKRLATLNSHLRALDKTIGQTLSPHRGKCFYVYHPAFSHLTDRYGLKQIAVEHEGKEPSTRRLSELINQARKAGVRKIITQPQFAGKGAVALAYEIDAKTVPLDPLAYDYTANMKRIAQRIAAAAVDQP